MAAERCAQSTRLYRYVQRTVRLSSVNSASLRPATQNLFFLGSKRTTKKPPLKGGRKGRQRDETNKVFFYVFIFETLLLLAIWLVAGY
jgi:hypothetical protein